MDNLFQVYLFNVTFQEKDGSKERPIVTIFYNEQAFSFEVCGIYKARDKYKSNPYYSNFMYKIKDYRYAKLKYPSYINVARPFNIPFTYLIGKKKFGKLSPKDAKELLKLYNKYWSERAEND